MIKTKLKALVMAVASVAAIAAAAPASATILGGSNGELYFSAWDTATSSSYTRDLGVQMSSFVSTNDNNATTVSFSFAADTTFTTWLVGKSNIKWNVVASDNVAGERVLTTHDAATAGNINGTSLINAANKSQAFLQSVNALVAPGNFSTHGASTAINGSSIASLALGNSVAYAGSGSFGSNFGNSPNFNNAHTGFGSTFMSLLSWQTSNATLALQNKLNNIDGDAATWTLASNGDLTYLSSVTAVPEPGTWAMMLVGLLGMGAVARRRVS